jgi:hypothetical protein
MSDTQVVETWSGTAPAATPLYEDSNGSGWSGALSEETQVFTRAVDMDEEQRVFIKVFSDAACRYALGYMRRTAVRIWWKDRPQK